MKNRPTWYTNDTDSSWDRVKAAFANDWEQTRHDFGSKTARDLNQDVDDTAKQMAGSPDSFENHEQAFPFGYAANRHFRSQYPTWNSDLESQLRQDYGTDFDRDRSDIRRAYEYRWGSPADMSQRDEARPR